MSTHAAALLLRDLKPIEVKSDETSDAPTSMFPLMPVADVLLTERRICQACGSIHDAPSDRVHRLLSSCAGDPFKRVLRPRKVSELPLDLRVVHTIEVAATHCAICWIPSGGWGEAWRTEPEKPAIRTAGITAIAEAMRKAQETKKSKKAPARITLVSAEQAADML